MMRAVVAQPRHSFARVVGTRKWARCGSSVPVPDSKYTPQFDAVSRTSGVQGYPLVNAKYVPCTPELPTFQATDTSTGTPSAKHWASTWNEEDIKTATRENVMLTWGPSKAKNGLPVIVSGEGAYVIDSAGKKYLDWTSQAVCCNLGYTVPERVERAIVRQLREAPFVYGGIANCPVRARLSALMGDICPGDLNGFLFPGSGSEANEAAIRMARKYTGRHKVISQYRSYHGGTTTALATTGDFRRHFAESGAHGHIKMFNPQPFGFSLGGSDEKVVEVCLRSLEEAILMEGPQTVAAFVLESVVGAGGCLIPPEGYFQGVRAICDKYGIMMILDEVMMGWFRTGPLFGFQHQRGVLPDIVTSAKGLTAAWMPMSMVAARQPIKEFFEENPLGWGSTYQAHPVAMACAYEVVKYMLEQDLASRVNKLQTVMFEEIQRLCEQHPSVRQGRALGLFGCLDLVHPRTGLLVQQLGAPMSPEVAALKARMMEKGVLGLFRPPLLHVAPPLIITEEQLRDGFGHVSEALSETLDLLA